MPTGKDYQQARADETLEVLLEYGVNHIDVAASYGDAELRLAPFLQQHRDDFFLATKTGERSADGARAQLHRSLERLGVDHVDIIQLHNLVIEHEQQTVFSEVGALEALVGQHNKVWSGSSASPVTAPGSLPVTSRAHSGSTSLRCCCRIVIR